MKKIPKLATEIVKLADLKPHPRNYRKHPEDQLSHIQHSLKEFGIYRNVVISKDGVIIAGHGLVEAAKKSGIKEIPAIRLKIGANDPAALRLLIGDNEIGHLSERDDRQLSEMLKDLGGLGDLLGTGFDKMMLANLAMITRPESEIKGFDEAAQWAGMPEYLAGEARSSFLIVSFKKQADRARFCAKLRLKLAATTKSIWYPMRAKEDISSVRFKEKK